MANDPPYQGYPQQPQQGNPGLALGVVSIVLGLTGCLSLVGLVLGFMSRGRSKRAGASTALGTVGIVLSTVALVISLAIAGVGVYVYSQASERCEELGPGTHDVDGFPVTCP